MALFTGCVKSSAPKTVVLPPTPCLLPDKPSPRANIPTLRDCDDLGDGTDICMSADDFTTVFILLKELDAWADLALACPGAQTMPRVEVTPTKAPVDDRKQI